MLRRLLTGFVLATMFCAPLAAQEPPEGAYADFIPGAEDIFSTTTEAPPDQGLVVRIFALGFAEQCGWALGGSPAMRVPEVYELSFRYLGDQADQPLRLYRFFCASGAYNEQHVYMLWDGSNGLRPVSFAQPTWHADHATPDDSDTPVVAMQLTGFDAMPTLVNSAFDPATGRISSHSCWRGICDASSQGTWVQDGPGFRLEHFAVDASYDGDVNPIPLVDYSTPEELQITPLPAGAVETSVTNN